MDTLILLLKLGRIIAAAILAAVYFIELANMPHKLRLNFKPFNCLLCLSTWLALGFYFIPGWVLNMLITCTIAGALANPIKNFIRNLNFRQ